MRDKGIACAGFNPFRPLLSIVMNHRDHRKITVIDGRIAYTGGFNLADEYINVKEKHGYWKDAGIRLTGSCVWSFTSMFLEIWDYTMGTREDYDRYRNTSLLTEEPEDDEERGFVQPYSDSPLDHEDVGENVYLHLIQHAQKYVYIFTPYLIIGSEMKTALVNAAKCGVDVRIVVPAIPDKKMVYLLTQADFAHLIKGGVKIYKYTPGFIHSKCFVVDDVHATVGTINLDYRSFYLHFECGAYLYRAKAVTQLKEDAIRTFEESHEVTLEECQNRLLIVRIFMGGLRLFAPLL
jgi:cardiolipin synthase